MNYLDIGNKTFIIDFTKVESILILDAEYENKTSETTETKEVFNDKGKLISTVVKTIKTPHYKEYDASKYDILRTLFEVLLNDNSEYDDSLGFDLAMEKASVPTKISFNTLIGYGILKEL